MPSEGHCKKTKQIPAGRDDKWLGVRLLSDLKVRPPERVRCVGMTSG